MLYVDNMFIMAPTRFQAQQVTVKVLELLIGLGWHINKDKCKTEPSQIREFLGFLVDTQGEFPMVKVPYHKHHSIGREVWKLLHDSGSGKVPAHQLTQVAGRIQSLSRVISHTLIYLRNLLHCIPCMDKQNWETAFLAVSKEAKIDGLSSWTIGMGR